MPWIPHKYTDGSIEWERVDELPISCPYCGHDWIYRGDNRHYATCHGTDTIKNYPEHIEFLQEKNLFPGIEWTWSCEKKVRLHPRLVNTHKKLVNKINFPNKNYEPIGVVVK